MMNVELLESEMKNKKISNKEIAEFLGIDVSTWCRKKNRPDKINIGEAERISEILCLSPEKAREIFLT